MCARSWLWSVENAGNLNSSLTEEYATVLNEMEFGDEGRMYLLNPTNMDVASIQHVPQGCSHQVNVESTSNPTPEPSQSHVVEDDNT
ncbi:hypothetical protein Lal_00035461 [Lupinus albus]|nr:hypothetical protein Lal_00035461 [Lupinus albus]